MSTVLVIDDDRDIRGLVEFKLARAGIAVLSASNGELRARDFAIQIAQLTGDDTE